MALRCILATTAIAPLIGGQAFGFEAFGFRSGMSPAEVEAAAPLGFHVHWFNSTGIVAADNSPTNIYVTLTVCAGRLVAVIRPVDADSEWLPRMKELLQQRGQPQVRVSTDAWTGPGGGDISTVELVWRSPGEKVILNLTPEGRDGTGQLRFTRSASIAYDDVGPLNTCFSPANR